MVKFISTYLANTSKITNRYKKSLIAVFIVSACIFAYSKPQQFVDLWLTRDQQGQILFNNGHYQKASVTFKSTQWQAYSSYGAEQYKNSAILYGQFSDLNSQVAKANALAQGREYIDARNLYKQILTKAPNNIAASTNIVIVQSIIDDVNRMSESQAPEDGEAIKDLGDAPQTGDGAEKKEAPQKQELEQLSAEQLLLNPNLNKMWLRQVQKNPASFLSQKFYMQQVINNKGANDE